MVLWQLVKSGLGIGAIIDEVGDAEPLDLLVEQLGAPRVRPVSGLSRRKKR